MCFRFSQSQLSNLARSTRICARSLVPSDQIQTITNSSALSLIVFQLPSFAFTKPSNSRSWGCSRVLSCRLVRPVQASSSFQTWTEQPLTLAQALKQSIGFLLEYVQLVFVFFFFRIVSSPIQKIPTEIGFSLVKYSHTHTLKFAPIHTDLLGFSSTSVRCEHDHDHSSIKQSLSFSCS